jgi:hypothetical protein
MRSSRPRSVAPKLSRNIVHQTRALAGPSSPKRVAVVLAMRAPVTLLAAASTPPPSAASAKPGVPSALRRARNSPDSHRSAAGIAKPMTTAAS